LKRVLTSNPAAIETVATTLTQIVVEGKAPGTSSLILWDDTEHSQMLDVIVDPDVSALRTAIERGYPGQQISVDADGGRLILSGTVSDPRISEELTKMANSYSTQVVNSLTIPQQHELQMLLEVKFAEIDRTRINQFGINILSPGGHQYNRTTSTQQFGPPSLSGGSGGAAVVEAAASAARAPQLLWPSPTF